MKHTILNAEALISLQHFKAQLRATHDEFARQLFTNMDKVTIKELLSNSTPDHLQYLLKNVAEPNENFALCQAIQELLMQ